MNNVYIPTGRYVNMLNEMYREMNGKERGME